jgi:uncharacterized protein DUF4333
VTSPSAPGEPGDEQPGSDTGESSAPTSTEPERPPEPVEPEERRPATGVRWPDSGTTPDAPGDGSLRSGPASTETPSTETPSAETPSTETPSIETPSPADDDATPPSGLPAAQRLPQSQPPSPGNVVPDRTTGTAPTPAPGAAWPHPGYQGPGQPHPGYQPPGHQQGGPTTWPQTAPAWAPPPPAAPRDPARRRRVRRIVLLVVLGVVVVAAIVVALLAFLVGPRFARYDVLDRAAVERGVGDVVSRDWHRQVTGVTCPDGERVRPGVAFVCTASVDGRPQQIPVDVVDENGGYEVGQPR